MNANKKLVNMQDRKGLLSTLWIFAMFNYLYCDVMGLMDPSKLSQYLAGNVGGIQITQGFLLGAAILMVISTAMILLSRVLPYRANRWANITAGILMTVVQLSTLFLGSTPALYYLFFSLIEIGCTAFITGYAWRWNGPEKISDEHALISVG